MPDEVIPRRSQTGSVHHGGSELHGETRRTALVGPQSRSRRVDHREPSSVDLRDPPILRGELKELPDAR